MEALGYIMINDDFRIVLRVDLKVRCISLLAEWSHLGFPKGKASYCNLFLIHVPLRRNIQTQPAMDY